MHSHLSEQETSLVLNNLNFETSSWGDATHRNGSDQHAACINYTAPTDASDLHNFTLHLAGWLGGAKWAIVRPDPTNALSYDQRLILSRIVHGRAIPDAFLVGAEKITFFDRATHYDNRIIFAAVLFHALVHDAHIRVFSSESGHGDYLAIQDGEVLFFSPSRNFTGAHAVIGEFTRSTDTFPAWVCFDGA